MGNEKETEKNIINKTTQKGQSQSFLVGLGKKIMQGVKIVGGLAKYVVTPTNFGKSGKHIIYDGKQVVNEILGNPVDENGYVHPSKLEPHSKCSIEIKGKGGGSVVFKASMIFIGNIAEMSDAQINEVNALSDENKNFDIVIRAANKIVIEIDVENIVSDIEANVDKITSEIKAKNKGKNEEEIERLVKKEIERLAIGKIIEEADAGLKGFAKISGGELKKYTDSQLLTDIGKELYQSYETQKDESKSPAKNPTESKKQSFGSSEIVSKAASPYVSNTKETNPQDTQEQMEEFFSMTVPRSRSNSYDSVISKNPNTLLGMNFVQHDPSQTEIDVSRMLNSPSTPNVSDKKGKGYSK